MTRKSKKDPTGQSWNRKRATKSLVTRLEKSRKEVIKLFLSLNYVYRDKMKAVNSLQTNELIYDYDLSGDDITRFYNAIQSILDGDLRTAQTLIPFDWFYKEFIEPPFRQGSMEELRDISKAIQQAQKSGAIPTPVTPLVIDESAFLISDGYRKHLQTSYATNYQRVKTLSSEVAKDVFTHIQFGIESGDNPTTIRRMITKRFDIAKFKAQRIARTEVNSAYNNSKLHTTDLAGDQLDLNLGVMHISALSPTTRSSHAHRHGLAYSTVDQMSWWNQDANRINCLCTTQTVVLDNNGKMVNDILQEETRAEEKEYFEN